MGNKSLRIYVAAAKQNDGKTTAALGLMNVIRESYPKIGYIKPVGQHFNVINSKKIDKDVSLMEDVFHIGSGLQNMSPVAVPRGFTEQYIHHGDKDDLKSQILSGFSRASKNRDFMIIEGTGHAGVGSVFDLSNAAVAKLLNSPVIIVASGGIGRPIDEIMLNKALFDSYGVEVLGVIINKVKPEKFEKINKVVRLGLDRLGISVLGVTPFFPILTSPNLQQVLEDMRGTLISGEKFLDRTISKFIVGAMPPSTALDYFKGDVLLITPGNREDLLLTALISASSGPDEDYYSVRGILLTGGLLPHQRVLHLLEQSHIVVIAVEDDTFTAAQRINNMIIKIKPHQVEKIKVVKSMVKEYVDVRMLFEKLGAVTS